MRWAPTDDRSDAREEEAMLVLFREINDARQSVRSSDHHTTTKTRGAVQANLNQLMDLSQPRGFHCIMRIRDNLGWVFVCVYDGMRGMPLNRFTHTLGFFQATLLGLPFSGCPATRRKQKPDHVPPVPENQLKKLTLHRPFCSITKPLILWNIVGCLLVSTKHDIIKVWTDIKHYFS